MQLLVKTLTGKTIEIDVEASDPIGPTLTVPNRLYQFCEDLVGRKSICEECIQGGAKGVLAQAAASEIAKFWKSEDGIAVIQYLQQEMSEEFACAADNEREHKDLLEDLVVEFSRFFLLKAIAHDIAAPAVPVKSGDDGQSEKRRRVEANSSMCRYAPSSYVDQVWHALLLFPRAYQLLCAALLGEGRIIDHDPRSGSLDDSITAERNVRYLNTYKSYMETFRLVPPKFVWSVPDAWYRDPMLCTDLSLSIKGKIEKLEGIPPCQQKLIFAGKLLEDSDTVAACKLSDGNTLSLMVTLRGC